MRLTALALALSLTALPGLSFAEDDHAHKSEAEGVTILHAWAQASDGPEARVFMEIANESDAEITLAGAEADGIATEIHLMATSVKAGGKPEEIPALPIEAGSELDLTPTGVFLVLEGLSAPLAKGDTFEMHVDLEPVGELEVIVEVEAADATAHSHAGHAH